MKILILDANSILNRAFYGIRSLSTKDGIFTNGIYGFLNILMKLKEQVEPDKIFAAVTVFFISIVMVIGPTPPGTGVM